MKVIQFFLVVLIGVELIEITRADDNMDAVPMKRPFCNAFTGCGRKRDAALAIYPQQQLPLLYRALRLYPGLRNAIIEAKMRQRLAAEDPTFIVEQQQPLEQSFALPRGDAIY